MKLPRDVSSAQVVRALTGLGYTVVRQTGSHIRLDYKGRRITVSVANPILPATLQSVIREVRAQTGIARDKLLNLIKRR